jgi:hypothetical protein
MRGPLQRTYTYNPRKDITNLRKALITRFYNQKRGSSLSPRAINKDTSTNFNESLNLKSIRLNNEFSCKYLTSSSYRDYINKLNRPRYLDFSSCDNLEEYIHYSDNIVSIKFSNTKIRRIPDNMQSVKFLYLHNCRYIRNIDNISKMMSLIKLDLSNCYLIKDISPAMHVPVLNVAFCQHITDFSMLSNVIHLNLTCTKINDLSALRHVRKIILAGCQNITVDSLTGLKCTYLDISHCYNIKSIPQLTDIKHIILKGTSITNLEGLESCDTVNVEDCTLIKDFTPVYNVPHLNILRCWQITDIRSFKNATLKTDYRFNGCEFKNVM